MTPTFNVGDYVQITENTANLRIFGAPTSAAGMTGRVVDCNYRTYASHDGHAYQVNTDEIDSWWYVSQALTRIQPSTTELANFKPTNPELEAFKKKVVEVAVREAKKHGWCNDIKYLVEEVGLEWPKEVVEVKLRLPLGDVLFEELDEVKLARIIVSTSVLDLSNMIAEYDEVE